MASLQDDLDNIQKYIDKEKLYLYSEPTLNGAPWPDLDKPVNGSSRGMAVYTHEKAVLDALAKRKIIGSKYLTTETKEGTLYKAPLIKESVLQAIKGQSKKLYNGMESSRVRAAAAKFESGLPPIHTLADEYALHGLAVNGNTQIAIALCDGDASGNVAVVIRAPSMEAIESALKQSRLISKKPPYLNYTACSSDDHEGYVAVATIPNQLADIIRRTNENDIPEFADFIDDAENKEAMQAGRFDQEGLLKFAAAHLPAASKDSQKTAPPKKKPAAAASATQKTEPKPLAELAAGLEKHIIAHQSERHIDGTLTHYLDFSPEAEEQRDFKKIVQSLSSNEDCATPLKIFETRSEAAKISYDFSEKAFRVIASAAKKQNAKGLRNALNIITKSSPSNQFSISTHLLDNADYHKISQAAQREDSDALGLALESVVKPKHPLRYSIDNDSYEKLANVINLSSVAQLSELPAQLKPSIFVSRSHPKNEGKTHIPNVMLHTVGDGAQTQHYLTAVATASIGSPYLRASDFLSNFGSSHDVIEPEFLTKENETPAIVRIKLSPQLAEDVASQFSTSPETKGAKNTRFDDQRDKPAASIEQLNKDLFKAFPVEVIPEPESGKTQKPESGKTQKPESGKTQKPESGKTQKAQGRHHKDKIKQPEPIIPYQQQQEEELNLLSELQEIIQDQESKDKYIAAAFANISGEKQKRGLNPESGKHESYTLSWKEPTLYVRLSEENIKKLKAKKSKEFPWLKIDWGASRREGSGKDTYQTAAFYLSPEMVEYMNEDLLSSIPTLSDNKTVSSIGDAAAMSASAALVSLAALCKKEQERVELEEEGLQKGLSPEDLKNYLAYKRWKDQEILPPKPNEDIVQSFDAYLKDFRNLNAGALYAVPLVALLDAYEERLTDAERKQFKPYKRWKLAMEGAEPKPSDEVIEHIEAIIDRHEKTLARKRAYEEIQSKTLLAADVEHLSDEEIAKIEAKLESIAAIDESLKALHGLMDGLHDKTAGLLHPKEETNHTRIEAVHPEIAQKIQSLAHKAGRLKATSEELSADIEAITGQVESYKTWVAEVGKDRSVKHVLVVKPTDTTNKLIAALDDDAHMTREPIKLTNPLGNSSDVVLLFPTAKLLHELGTGAQVLADHPLRPEDIIPEARAKLNPMAENTSPTIIPRAKSAEEVITREAKSAFTSLRPRLVYERQEHDYTDHQALQAIGEQAALVFTIEGKRDIAQLKKLAHALDKNDLTLKPQYYGDLTSDDSAFSEEEQNAKRLIEAAECLDGVKSFIQDFSSEFNALHDDPEQTQARINAKAKELPDQITLCKDAITTLMKAGITLDPDPLGAIGAFKADLEKSDRTHAGLKNAAFTATRALNLAKRRCDEKLGDFGDIAETARKPKVSVNTHTDCLFAGNLGVDLDQIDTQLGMSGDKPQLVKLYIAPEASEALSALPSHTKNAFMRKFPTKTDRALTSEQIAEEWKSSRQKT